MHTLTEEEFQTLESVDNFHALADLAIQTLARMKESHPEIIQICGPMSTGGLGDLQKNMERFFRAVDVAQRRGAAVFNQGLFQGAMIRICAWEKGQPYPTDLLEIFYKKVFLSGYISKGLFLPDWESSVGAKWEREILSSSGIAVEEYPQDWLGEVI